MLVASTSRNFSGTVEILSLVQFLFSFVYVYDNELKKENKT